MMPMHTTVRALATSLVLLGASLARGHGGDGGVHIDMLVASTAPGAGALALLLNRPAVVRTSDSDTLGGLTVYTATDPGFAPLEADLPSRVRYRLAPGTRVWVELVERDDGAALKVDGTLLGAAGDRALLGTAGGGRFTPFDQHPEYTMALDAPPGAYRTTTLHIRLRTDSPRYRPSRGYRLTLSNGHLPRNPTAAPSDDPAQTACRQAVAEGGWEVLRSLWNDLAPATDHDPAARAVLQPGRALADMLAQCGPEAAGAHDAAQLSAYLGLTETKAASLVTLVGASPAGACRAATARHGLAYLSARARNLRACLNAPVSRRAAVCGELRPASGATMLGRVLRARARAARAIARRCPDPGAVERFLERAACHADDLVSAAFPTARRDLDERKVLGVPRTHRLSDYFPCVAP